MTEKRGPGRPKKESQEEIQEREDLETLFSDINQTYTVKVFRTDPEWASGYMGKFHVGGGRTLSLDEIKNRFGGRVFDLRVYTGSKPGITSRKTVEIDDVPRREGFEVFRDGTSAAPSKQGQPEQAAHADPVDEILNSDHLPFALRKKLMLLQLGLGDAVQAPQHNQIDLQAQMQMQQTMNEMMNQSRRSQLEMQQQQFEMTKQMMSFKRELEESAKPKNALGEVDNVIHLVREINGIKSELGASDEPLSSQLLGQTMPLVESALMEFLALKKLQAQNQLKQAQIEANNAPALPQRVQASPVASPPLALPKNDPVALAEEMAAVYSRLSPEEQQRVMLTFVGKVEENEAVSIQTNENIELSPENDTIADVSETILDPEDRAILNDQNSHEASDVQNVEHAGTTEDHDPLDRQGDPGRFPIPSH